MIINHVIARARDLLHDSGATYRWSETAFLRWLNDGIREIRKRRPDVRFDADGDPVEHVEIAMPADWSTGATVQAGDRVRPTTYATTLHVFVCEVPGVTGGTEPTWDATEDTANSDGTATWYVEKLELDDQHLTPLASYLCHRALARDSADTANAALADRHLADFLRGIGQG